MPRVDKLLPRAPNDKHKYLTRRILNIRLKRICKFPRGQFDKYVDKFYEQLLHKFFNKFIFRYDQVCSIPPIFWNANFITLNGRISSSKKIKIFIHSVFCLTTGPTPLPKRFLHIVQSRASSFKWEYPLLSLMSSSSFLRLLPRLLVTSISPFYLYFDNLF